ncbi:MAG: DUF4386 domain-containing protein [Prevotellaceae bacterium]|jgi:hypothetical protein|nr:DUF4386 domain-containing protein [Prevotellaceae bacterium]
MKKNCNRLPGILYLCTIIFGLCAQIIRSNILVFGDDNIFENINNSIFILRLGFFSDILMILFYLLTAWTLFNLLKLINKNQSLLFFVCTIISVSIMSINMINHIAIIEINSADYFNNSTYNLKSLTQFFSNLHNYGYLIAQIFFGLWLLPLGIIIVKSKIMPKYFGIMLIAATFGHLSEIMITFLLPGNDFIIYPGLIIAMAGEFSFCFRLLFKGINYET